MVAGVFSFNLEAFETACATAPDCTFDKADYVPYAFGILWNDGGTCSNLYGPYIISSPGGPLPFDGIYCDNYASPPLVVKLPDVTITSNDFLSIDSSKVFCDDFQFLDGCFSDFRDADGYRLTFSLLTSTTGLEEDTAVDLFFLWSMG